MTSLLRSVLSGPFHRLASSRFLTLVSVGDHEFDDNTEPLRYLRFKHDLLLLLTDQNEDLLDVIGQELDSANRCSATVHFRGKPVAMHLSLLNGEDRDTSIIRYLQRYPGQWRELDVDPGADAEAVKKAAQLFTVAQLSPAVPFIDITEG